MFIILATFKAVNEPSENEYGETVPNSPWLSIVPTLTIKVLNFAL